MRFLVALVLVVPVLAHADDASRDLVIEYTRIARGAAIGGNCDIARDLAAKVKALDEAYYNTAFVTVPEIATCLPPPVPAAPIIPQVDPEPPISPPSATPPQPDVTRQRIAPSVNARPVDLTRPPKPPLDAGRLVGEVFLGYLGGALGIGLGGLAGAVTCNDNGDDEFGCLGPVIIGAFVGGSLLLAAGVYAAGASGNQTGSFGWTWFGTLIGSAIGIAAASGSSSGRGDDITAGVLLIGSPMIGALLGFNLSRTWRDPGPPKLGSLFRFDRGKASLGIPLVLRGEIRGTPTTTIPLLSGSF